MRRLTRCGRLSISLVVITTITCTIALNGVKSISETFALTLCADIAAVGLAFLVSDRPFRRRVRRGA